MFLKETQEKINIKISHHRRKQEEEEKTWLVVEDCLRRRQSKVKPGIYGQMPRLSKMFTFSLWKCIPARPMSPRAPEIHPSSAAPPTALAEDHVFLS